MQNNLRSIRKQKQLTLKDLSDKTGLSIGLIGNFETGQRGISGDALKKVADALAVTVAEILQSDEVDGQPRADPEPCPRCAELEKEIVWLKDQVAGLVTALAAKPSAGAARACGADAEGHKEKRGA